MIVTEVRRLMVLKRIIISIHYIHRYYILELCALKILATPLGIEVKVLKPIQF